MLAPTAPVVPAIREHLRRVICRELPLIEEALTSMS